MLDQLNRLVLSRKNAFYLIIFVILGHIALSIYESRSLFSGNVKIPWLLFLLSQLIIPVILIIKLTIESGIVWVFLKSASNMKFQFVWRISWVLSSILLIGEVVNQIFLNLKNSQNAVIIGLNMLVSTSNFDRLAYLILSEITPFSIIGVYLTAKLINNNKVLYIKAIPASIILFIINAGINISLQYAAGL